MLCLYSYNKYLYSILYLYYMLYSSISFINAHTFSFPFSAPPPTDFFYSVVCYYNTHFLFFSFCTPPKFLQKKIAQHLARLYNTIICKILIYAVCYHVHWHMSFRLLYYISSVYGRTVFYYQRHMLYKHNH